MNIAKRISLILVLALLSLLCVSVYSLHGLGAAEKRFEYVGVNTIPSVKNIYHVAMTAQQIRIALRDHVISSTAEDKASNEKTIADLSQKIDADLNDYEKNLISDDTDRAMLQADRDLMKRYSAVVQSVMEKSRSDDVAGVRTLMSPSSELTTLAKDLSKQLVAHIDYNWQLYTKMDAENSAAYHSEVWGQIIICVLSVLVVGGMGYWVTREISMRLRNLVEFMSTINQTLDFTSRIRIVRMDELGQTADAFNKLIDKLQGSLREIARCTGDVAASATRMAATSSQVALASHEQSEAASNMAATVEEMTVSVNHVADKAHETTQLASEAGGLANDGEAVIGQVVSGVQDISVTVNAAAEQLRGLENQSVEIERVVQVIKEVADQTNLLALNAAIEAARAGEQGRGFAVVADEVRKLAERTSTSTVEIARTVEAMRTSSGHVVSSMQSIVKKVSEGVARAEEANLSIKRIGEGSHASVEMVSEIAGSIREQGAATNNIAIQVERIAQMSEECSSAASAGSDTAKILDQEAANMQRIVRAYTLEAHR